MIIQQISLVNRPTVPTSIDRPGPFEGWGVRLGS
jgi:hypothetical protein